MRSLALPPVQKNLSAVVALPAVQPDYPCIVLYNNAHLKNTSFGCRCSGKTQLRSAAAPALSSSVAAAVRLPLPGTARRSLPAAATATVLLSLSTVV